MAARGLRNVSPTRTQAIHVLALDAALAQLVQALNTRGVRSVLLKGRSFATWLYDDPSERGYGDIDLVTDPATPGAAEAVISSLGYVKQPCYARHHTVWVRNHPRRVQTELHSTLYLTRCSPEVAWTALSRGTDDLTVAGQRVAVPSLHARALVVALHAAQHGRGCERTLADLDRAIAKVSVSEWRATAVLASQLGALDAFGAGLRLDPNGRQIADSLSIPCAGSRELMLRLATPPDTAIGFERLATARGSERLRLVAAEFFPSASLMRSWKPLARRGTLGLAVAYLWRPFWLLWKAGAGVKAWRQAGVESRRASQPSAP